MFKSLSQIGNYAASKPNRQTHSAVNILKKHTKYFTTLIAIVKYLGYCLLCPKTQYVKQPLHRLFKTCCIPVENTSKNKDITAQNMQDLF